MAMLADAQGSAGQPPTPEAGEGTTSLGAQLLLVDDDEASLRSLSRMLKRSGFQVVTSLSGDQAVPQLESNDFDVVISDVQMPGMSGLQVLQAVKAAAADTEVIMLTGHASLETAVECLRAGAFDLVQKPCQAGEMTALVRRAIERRQLRGNAILHDACSAVFAAGDREALPYLITEVAGRVMAADNASLMLVDGKGDLYVSHNKALSPEMQVEANAKAGSGIAAKVAAGRKPVIINGDASGDQRFAGAQARPRVRSSIVYPLYSGDTLLGVLNINRRQSQRPFRAQDLDRATVLAAQIVLALENRQLTRTLVASEKLAAIGQLAAGITHEVNNPVAYVLANTSFVQEGLKKVASFGESLAAGGDPRALWQEMGGREAILEIQTAVDDIAKGASRIREIVGDVRTLATSERGTNTLFDVNDAIRSAARITGALVRRVAELHLDLGQNTHVSGNPGQLSQVFLNLIVNAADAIEQAGQKSGQIRVTSALDQSDVVVEVTDTGCGIAPHDLRRIFEAFYSTKPANKGTGLGLSISREFVERHGGNIAAKSEPGRTVFTVRIPAAKTE